MAGTSRKKPVFANPFYVGLMVVSTLFVLTALGYLVAPNVIAPGPVQRGETSRAFATWLDRHGPVILGIEFVVMLVTGVLAMVTDDWFSGVAKPGSQPGRGEVRR
ncbi:MAG: hypothetical protein WBQ29_07200 [Isosphaeraceae bacterium]|jgi:hypothetical protein